MAKIMPQPGEELLAWCPTWKDEPRKRQPFVSIWIWVPQKIAAEESAHGEFRRLGVLADYIQANTGFTVARTVGWSCGGTLDDVALNCVAVTVSSKEVRARLADAG